MKVSLKLSINHLNVLVFAYESFIKPLPIKSRESKVARSILDKIIIRFKKKQLDQSFTPRRLSKPPTKFSMSFEIYEAHYLEQFILLAETKALDDYDRNVLGFVKSNINQQLA